MLNITTIPAYKLTNKGSRTLFLLEDGFIPDPAVPSGLAGTVTAQYNRVDDSYTYSQELDFNTWQSLRQAARAKGDRL